MSGVRILGVIGVLAALVWLQGCASLRPDQYQGEGQWIRGDGTTYAGAPPLMVTAVEITHAHVRERETVTEEKSTNEQGQVVIREKIALSIHVEVDVSVRLENGESHSFRWITGGAVGTYRSQSGVFTATNGKIYRVSGNIRLLQRPTVTVRVRAPGPIDYRTTLNVD